MPHVVPAGFGGHPQHDTTGIGGHDFAPRNNHRVRCHPKVALVVADIAPVSPWLVRGVKTRGQVEVEETGRNRTRGRAWHRRCTRSRPGA
jgi:hypothetical protein